MKQHYTSLMWLAKSIMIIGLFSFSIGSKACVASFTYVVDSATRQVTFTSTATGSNLDIQWKFDGTQWGTGTTYTHQFHNPGYHRVCMSVSSVTDTSCHSTFCDSIFIPGTAPCHANITVMSKQTGVLPELYFFEGWSSSGANLVYEWTISGGTKAWDLYSPALRNQNFPVGVHTVCLNIRNALDSTCHDDTCITVVVDSPDCYARFKFHADTTQNPPLYYFEPFNKKAGNVYSWSFQNMTGGMQTSSDMSPQKSFPNNTVYILACLTITNAALSCSHTYCDSIFSDEFLSSGLLSVSDPVKIGKVYPNPADRIVYTSIHSQKTESGMLSVINLVGQVLMQKEVSLNAGQNQLEANIDQLPAGLYFIRIQSNSGSAMQRFSKN